MLAKERKISNRKQDFFPKLINTKFLVRWNNWEINLTLMKKKTSMSVGESSQGEVEWTQTVRTNWYLVYPLKTHSSYISNTWKIFPVACLRSKYLTFNCFEMYWKTIHSAALVSITWILAIFSHRNFCFGVFCTQKHFT